jgi:outer membrane protein OmpA-like peptidoglycan-associated protein
MRIFLRFFAPLIVFAVHFSGSAQTTKLLRESEISEATLIEALTPAPALPGNVEASANASGEGEALGSGTARRTRSIRVTRDDAPPGKGPIAAPKTAAASLLITFETNSATLTPRARLSLDVVARALKSDSLGSYRFSIEGHADPRGNEGDNLELSRGRAESVAAYLSEQHQVARVRLSTIGKGQTEIINLTQIDAPENRRVTIKTVIQ